MLRGIVVTPFLVALVSLSITQLGEGWDQGEQDERPHPGGTRFPVRLVERPLTLTRGIYGLTFDLGVSQLAPEVPIVSFLAGTGYGISDDFEIGINVLPVTFSPAAGTGLEYPSVFLKYRLVRGAFEVAVGAQSQLPFGSPIAISAGFMFRAHLGRFAVIDCSPTAGALFGDQIEANARAPVEIGLQFGERFALSLKGEANYADFYPERLVANASVKLSYTIPNQRGALGDIGVVVTSPNYSLRGELLPDPEPGNYFFGGVVARFFLVEEPGYAWEDL